mmetsp:Transcript_6860/g.9763  ORF Transcript_6860/g.9763 Transcript_6860/m.9763 type:complete len:202 (-) Transcript_6860:1194-1799(-)
MKKLVMRKLPSRFKCVLRRMRVTVTAVEVVWVAVLTRAAMVILMLLWLQMTPRSALSRWVLSLTDSTTMGRSTMWWTMVKVSWAGYLTRMITCSPSRLMSTQIIIKMTTRCLLRWLIWWLLLLLQWLSITPLSCPCSLSGGHSTRCYCVVIFIYNGDVLISWPSTSSLRFYWLSSSARRCGTTLAPASRLLPNELHRCFSA